MKRKRFFSLFSLFVCFSLVVLGFVGLASAANHTVVISHDGNGKIQMVYGTNWVWAGSYSIPDGEEFWMYAIPDAGYVFDHWNWTGSATGSGDTYPLHGFCLSDFNVEAHFRLATDSYYVTCTTSGGGTAWLEVYTQVSMFNGIFNYASGSTVNVNEYPNRGWQVNGLKLVKGGVTSWYYSDFSFTLDGNASVTVYFIPIGATIAPTAVPSSTGGAVPALPDNFITIVEALLVVFALPFMVMVGAPKVGIFGFMLMMVVGVACGVFFLGLPFYFLILAGLGVGLMFFSAANRMG